MDVELERSVCYFNDVSYAISQYAIGQFERSGNELLHCEVRGSRIRKDMNI